MHRKLSGEKSDQYLFLNPSNEYFEFQVLVRGNGPCSHSGRIEDDVFSRPCTPVFHFHEDQVETFTVLEGEMGYTIEINEPKQLLLLPSDPPLRIAQGIGHTFWNKNKEEDLRVLVRIAPPLLSIVSSLKPLQAYRETD